MAENPAHDQARLQLAIRASGVGFWDWDLSTDQIRLSAEYQRQSGYGESEFAHPFQEWVERLHPEDRQQVVDSLRA
ncbi:MAG: PAS domain-containing protein, partial [Verrucomicrobia bacterium]|nr:PAS domain-containing protein [Verrucomicrobiota bacterium]